MSQQNPFSYAYDRIYSALTAWEPLMAVVAIGNVRNLDVPQYKQRPNNAGDRPEVKVTERRIIGKLFTANSLGVVLQVLYPIEIKSGRQGVDQANLVTVLVMQALTKAGPLLGDNPVPNNIIDRAEWVDASLVPVDKDSKLPQYTVSGGVMVTMSFHRNDFLAAEFT